MDHLTSEYKSDFHRLIHALIRGGIRKRNLFEIIQSLVGAIYIFAGIKPALYLLKKLNDLIELDEMKQEYSS
jgi:hypothetical protein